MLFISFYFNLDERYDKNIRQKRELLVVPIVKYFISFKIISRSSLIVDAWLNEDWPEICVPHISAHSHATTPFSVDLDSPRPGEQGQTAAGSTPALWAENRAAQIGLVKLYILMNFLGDLCFKINGLKL